MKTLTEYLWFETKSRRELIRLTDTVAGLVRKSGIQEGMVLVSAMHITAGSRSSRPKGRTTATTARARTTEMPT